MLGSTNCQAMGHHHPQVNHSLSQLPHAHGLALAGVDRVKSVIIGGRLLGRCRNLQMIVAASVVSIGRGITPDLQRQRPSAGAAGVVIVL